MDCRLSGNVTFWKRWLQANPKLKDCKLPGGPTLFMLWLEALPKLKDCELPGKATLSTLWLKSPARVCSVEVLEALDVLLGFRVKGLGIGFAGAACGRRSRRCLAS